MDKLNFVVWSPPYSESSGGIIALHKLAHNLAELGEKSYILSKGINSKYKGVQINENDYQNFDKDKTVVIYPEVVKGDILGAKYVVRWLLNTPNVIRYSIGNGKDGVNDLIFKFAPAFKAYDESKVLGELRAFELNLDTFVNRNEERSGMCHIVRKGIDKGLHDKDSICLDGYESKGNQYLADIFNKYEVFISYDNACFLSAQAALCGCLSIVVPDNLSKEEWLSKFPYFKDGIAYGLSDIPRAMRTQSNIKENLLELERKSIELIKKFISICYHKFLN